MTTMHTRRLLVVAIAVLGAGGCTTGADDETSPRPPSPTPTMISTAFDEDLTAAGIPNDAHLTLESWALSACQLLPRMGMSDREVVANLPTDVAANGVTLTPEQATKVWASAKVNVCRLPKATVLPPG